MTEVHAKDVTVDKLYRARCHLHPCGWMGTERGTFAAANAEREAHITIHRLALDDAGPEVTAPACGRCGNPVAKPGETRRDGQPSDRAQYCDACIDRCHEATDFAHICQICATPAETARGLVP